jgi:hypothetical protein
MAWLTRDEFCSDQLQEAIVARFLYCSVCRFAKPALAVATCSIVFVIWPGFAQGGTLSLTCGTAAGPTQAEVPYTDTCNAGGGAPPYQWNVNLPAGLSYNVVATIPISTFPPTTTPIAIQITGAPATAGSYTYTVKVADSTLPAAQTATQTFTLPERLRRRPRAR